MSQLLTAKEQPIDKVFGSDYVFSIPSYQRPYSWGTEQAQELLEDLLAAMGEAPTEVVDTMPYFLGSAVLIKAEALPNAEVVDGQQRLTTLTILLSAIRHVSSDAEVQAEVTGYIYEKGKLATGTPDRFRLAVRPRDANFFRKYVQKEKGLGELFQFNGKLSEVEQRIRDNAAKLVAVLESRKPHELMRLFQFLVQRCYLVLVSTPDLDSAYRIFGVMNSRGLDLSATDVLKAEIIGAMPEALREVYTTRWEDEEERMGRERFGDLFSHIRTVYLKAKSQATLLKDFRENVPALRDAMRNAPQALLDQVILPMAEDFEQIVTSRFSSTQHVDAINGHLHWLNRLEFQDWIPPTLAFLSRHRNAPNRVLEFLADMERLAFSMALRREEVNQRIRRFANVTKVVEGGRWDVWADQKLDDGNTNAKVHNARVDALQALYVAGDVARLEAFPVGSNAYAKRLRLLSQDAIAALKSGVDLAIESPLQLTADECVQTIAVLNGELYGKLNTRLLTVLLKRLDQLLSNQNATYTGDSSIEHVLPQSPALGSTWLQWIPGEEARTHWVHRLGNLVLLSRHKNSEAQNYDFDKKKHKYFASQSGVTNFALTTQVMTHAVWDESVLQHRHQAMLGQLAAHWRLA